MEKEHRAGQNPAAVEARSSTTPEEENDVTRSTRYQKFKPNQDPEARATNSARRSRQALILIMLTALTLAVSSCSSDGQVQPATWDGATWDQSRWQ